MRIRGDRDPLKNVTDASPSLAALKSNGCFGQKVKEISLHRIGVQDYTPS